MRRLQVESAQWHVFCRGARRLVLYREPADFRVFLSLLARTVGVSGCILWAYTLMSNHFHLILEGSTSRLTDCMRRLNQWYSAYHNEKYGLSGHTFDGPYKAYAQRSPFFLLRKIAYVFLNPVAAGMVSRAEDYRWSCVNNYLGRPGSPLQVDPTRAFKLLDIDLVKGREGFNRILEDQYRAPSRRSPDSMSFTDICQQEFAWLLQHARTLGEDLLSGEHPTVVAAYWGSQCGISPRAIAKALGEQDSSRVRQMLSRFRQQLQAQPDLAAKLPLP